MAEQSQEVIMKSKDVYYRGQLLDTLKAMSVRESAQYLPARSKRSVLRNFQIVEKFVQRCAAQVAQKKKIRTHLRDIIIVPQLVGYTIGIYNGKEFKDLSITAAMIGHRLGEFSLTRVKVTHCTAGIGATKVSKTDKK